MGSYNGFTHAVAHGEVTELKEFFWFYVSRNRRDMGEKDPIVHYQWNEDHERQKIAKAEAELAETRAHTAEYWEDELQKNTASMEADYTKWDGETLEQVARLQSMIDQFEEAQKTLPPALTEWHENVVKMFHADAEFNSHKDRTESKTTPDEFKAMMIEAAERAVTNRANDYERRKTNCQRGSYFISAAVECYGEPPQGIKVVDSSEMW